MKKIIIAFIIMIYSLNIFTGYTDVLAETKTNKSKTSQSEEKNSEKSNEKNDKEDDDEPEENGAKQYVPHAKYMFMMDVESGVVMYDQKADAAFNPGGLTKILTAITAIENTKKLSDKITVKDGIFEKQSGGTIGLEYGEVMTVRNMVEAMMLYDASDCAIALAHGIGKNYDDFIDKMNAIAKKAGATNSTFSNPDGYVSKDHKTTLRDMGLITKYAMQNETFAEIFKDDQVEIEATNKSEKRILFNKNQFLSSFYSLDNYNPNINGAKGYQNSSDDCGMVASYKTPQHNLLILCAKSDRAGDVAWEYNDVAHLITYAKDNFSTVVLLNREEFISEVNVPNAADSKRLLLVNEKEIKTILSNNYDTSKITRKTIVNENIMAPIQKGDELGKIEIYYGDEKCGESKLLAYYNMDDSFFEYVKYNFSLLVNSFYFKTIIFIIIALIVVRAISINKRKSKKRKK